MRLDLWLVEQGLCSSRARAREAIRAGHVTVSAQRVIRPAQTVTPEDGVFPADETDPWVSRAALKLVATLREEVCCKVKTWLDGLPGWSVIGLCDSPVLGSDGNREFLIAGHCDG